MVVCGKNGCGKTTILALAALEFHSPSGHFPINARRRPRQKENYTYDTFRDFFFKGPNDPDIAGVEVSWEYEGEKQIHIQKHSDKWMRYERRHRRSVHYLGVRRRLPAIEQNVLRFHFGGKWKGSEPKPLNPRFRDRVSDIMGRPYDEAEVISSSMYSVRWCRVGNPYSSFNMGSGEDILIHRMYILQECQDGSLIVIEEIELGLHPEPLIRLAKHLQEIILKKKLQVIVSSHSAHFIDSVPREARVLVQRSGKEHTVIARPTTRFALGYMAGQADPELHVYCEDNFASLMIEQALSADLRKRPHIVPVGSKSEMAVQASLREMRLAAAVHWYERGEISQEKAAQIAGLDRTDFLLALAREQADAFVVDLEDLKRELDRG
jgi:predicted HTH domain antitoxin